MINYWVLGAGLLYLGAGVQSAMSGKWWFAGMWLLYCAANLCLLMAEWRYK